MAIQVAQGQGEQASLLPLGAQVLADAAAQVDDPAAQGLVVADGVVEDVLTFQFSCCRVG